MQLNKIWFYIVACLNDERVFIGIKYAELWACAIERAKLVLVINLHAIQIGSTLFVALRLAHTNQGAVHDQIMLFILAFQNAWLPVTDGDYLKVAFERTLV